MKVAALWEMFEAYGVVMRPSWKSTQATHWPHLRPHFGHLQIEALKKADVTAYRMKRKKEQSRWGTPTTDATINREVHSLTAMLRWGEDEGHIPLHPLRGLKSAKEVRAKPRAMTRGERDLIVLELRAAGHELAAAILTFLYETGARPHEVLTMGWGQVELGKVAGQMMPVAVEFVHTKTGKPRRVPLNQKARMTLIARPTTSRYVFGREGGRYCAKTLNTEYREARKRAGLPEKLWMYAARKGRGTNLRRAGAHWLEIKEVLGHTDDRSARCYQEISDEDLAKATERAELAERSADAEAAVIAHHEQR